VAMCRKRKNPNLCGSSIGLQSSLKTQQRREKPKWGFCPQNPKPPTWPHH